MGGEEWRTAAMRAFPLLALILACSFKPELAHPVPPVMVESLLDARWSGERSLFDKSENLVQTASVDWTCRKVNPHEAQCEEELVYRDTGRPAEPGKPALGEQKEFATVTWRFDYMDRGPVALERRAGPFVQKGEVRGALLFLTGSGLIPRSDTSATVETRIFTADAAQKKLVQVEIYRRYGIELGRSITNWTRVDIR